MIVKIILKRLRSHLTKEEEILFKAWLSENKENISTYKRLEAFQHNHDQIPNIDNLDPREAWKLITATAQENKAQKRAVSINVKLLRYAALFIGVLGATFFYKVLEHNSEEVPNENASAITLELSNGKTQILAQQGAATIVNSNGQILGKKENGIVDYTQNERGSNKEGILEYNTIHIPNGEKFKIVLSDGTLVHLNSGSSLTYPISFIKGKERTVNLTGEAFFDVKKDKNSPFIVTSGSMGIRVLGTRFNVSSYPEDLQQTTVLIEGAVRIYEAGTQYQQEKATLLSPGFKAEWNDTLKETHLKKVNTDLYTGWLKGKLIMKKMNFATIIQRLQRHYGVKVTNEYEDLNDRIFTATFETENIQEVMETFQLETPFEYDINGDEIRIYKKPTLNKPAYETKS